MELKESFLQFKKRNVLIRFIKAEQNYINQLEKLDALYSELGFKENKEVNDRYLLFSYKTLIRLQEQLHKMNNKLTTFLN